MINRQASHLLTEHIVNPSTRPARAAAHDAVWPLDGAAVLRLSRVLSAILDHARTNAFFFDFDGTLVEIAPTPDSVSAPPLLPLLFYDLSVAANGAVALLSGRPLSTLDAYFSPLKPPGCGQHGLEIRLANGETHGYGRPQDLDDVRAGIHAVIDGLPGVTVEDKGLSIALHYRNAPELQNEVWTLVQALARGSRGPTEVRPGKMVVEIGLTGASKGSALHVLMDTAPFVGRRPVVFGDDLTDEHAFKAARDLGGVTIQVGDREASSAEFAVSGPSDVHRLMDAFAVAIDPEASGETEL